MPQFTCHPRRKTKPSRRPLSHFLPRDPRQVRIWADHWKDRKDCSATYETALIIVDMQNDFVEGGALAVSGGRALVPVVDQIVRDLGSTVLVVTSRDWHPLKAEHFDKWPVHCVANTKGAELVEKLELPGNTIHLFKGTSGSDDGYSALRASNTERVERLSNLART